MREPLFDKFNLPAKFQQYGPGQKDSIDGTFEAFQRRDIVLGEHPTGSGKTLIAVMLHHMMGRRMVYTCTTKSLQRQFMTDFPDAVLLLGRSNYPCGRFLSRFPYITANDCPPLILLPDKERQNLNPAAAVDNLLYPRCVLDCPYMAAKTKALAAQIAVLNIQYLLPEANYAGRFTDLEYLVLDEIDMLENALLSFVEINLSTDMIAYLGLAPPEHKTKFESWQTWAVEASQVVEDRIAQLHHDTGPGLTDANLKNIRRLKTLEHLNGKLGYFLSHVNAYWIWENKQTREGEAWCFKPILVGPFGQQDVWRHASKVLGMSATILGFEQIVKNIGIPREDWEGYASPSFFPLENRRVMARPALCLDLKHYKENIVKLPGAIDQILSEHPEEKGIIHTVSYQTANYLQQHLGELQPENRGRLLFHTPQNRLDIIKQFKESTEARVLASPSIERGEDFPDDVCRFIVIAKLPHLYLGDPQVKRRLYGHRDGNAWYTQKTAAALVQMSGRGVRHTNDRCVTYILDSTFSAWYAKNRGILPKWWADSLVWG